MNRILCPIDFSSTSLNAIEYAVELSKKFRSHLTLLHVFTEKDFNKIVGEASVDKSFKELLAIANGKLNSIVDTINKSNHEKFTCDATVELGDFIDELQSTIEKKDYDLLVMGTTGVSRVSGVFFGSNTEDVIENLQIPLLCIPEKARYEGIKKIVYASDYMQEDKIAIQEVISMATIYDARLSVLHINLGESESKYNDFVTELSSFIQYKKISFVNKRFKINVGLGIQEFINEEQCDMLVVYRKHRGFVEGLFHKSLTKTLAFSTDKPLYILNLK